MVNENNSINLMAKENLTKVEIVQELKDDEYKTPSYEEFMKTYKNDGNLNYDDLSGGSVGEMKECGPCSSCSGSNRNLKFKLVITLANCIGDSKGGTVYNIKDARNEAMEIVRGAGHWTDFFLSHFSQEDRKKLYDKINDNIWWHKDGHDVDESVCNKEIPDLEEALKDWALDELDQLTSEPYPGERGGGFLE